MHTLKALSLLALLAALPAWPQASTSTIRGTVRDQSGAVIQTASVTLTNTATNVTARTTTNEVGFYVFPSVLPGSYRLSAEAAGMQRFEAALTVYVQQVAVVDPVVRVGDVSAEVTVVDATPLLVVDNPTLGQVLERTRIEQLPLNSRSFSGLLSTVAGVESWRAYGMRIGTHEVVLDGAPMAARNTTWSPLFMRPPGLDTIEEFKVETNNSSAKYTRPVTAVVSTRSGTNQLHGSVFETHRSNFVLGPIAGKARARQDLWERAPQLIRNEWGASSGGPVYLPRLYNGKNRTFWFFAYEGARSNSFSTIGHTVPTEEWRRGDFRNMVDSQGRQYKIYDPWTTNTSTWERQQVSYNGQLNVIDPKRISPLGKYLLDITPLPTHPDVNPLVTNNWWGAVPRPVRNYTTTTRLDHKFSDRDHLYGRYTHGNYYSWTRLDNGPPTTDGVSNNEVVTAPSKVAALSYVRTISPTLFNETIVSVSHEKWRTATGGAVKYADQLGLPNPFDVTGWPQLTGTGLSRLGWATQSTMGSNFTYYVLDHNVTKIHRKHELQFGFHGRYDQLNTLPDQQHNQGVHNWDSLATSLYDSRTSRTNPQATPQTGHQLANLFLGVMNYGNQMVRGQFYTRGHEYALYFQDNWKVAPRLTLNLGLRWEYWPALTEKNNLMSSFDLEQRAIVMGTDLATMYRLGATVPAVVDRFIGWGAKFITYQEAGLPRALMYGNSKNFGPRLGFAYRSGIGKREFVLRGGYRASFYPIPVRYWTATMRANAPTIARFENNLSSSAQAPDRLPNYGMRSVPTIVSGVNSRDAVRLDDPVGLSRGTPGANFFDPHQPDGKVHDWNVTLETEIMERTVARVAYVGNHGLNMEQVQPLNDPTPNYIWYVTTGQPLPTGEYSGVARRPYDQQVYGTLRRWTKSGWSNYNGVQLELERRFHKGYGFQIHYVVGNTFAAGGQNWSSTSLIPELNQFLPGAVPADRDERNRFLNYQRDTDIPKHRVRWNWIVDLPFGHGKWLGKNAEGALDRIIGGWQIAGRGSLATDYFALPTDIYPTGTPIEIYGYKYPIEDCTSGVCYPGYLWWNGYIPANRINSYDANGKPNGIMGVPANYKPAGQPLIPWPKNPDPNDPMYQFYGNNTTWVTLKNNTVQRLAYDDGLHPWRQQYLPTVRQWGLDASLFKVIPANERLKIRFSADLFNVLNHPGNPTAVGGNGVLSTRSSGQSSRELQLTLRLMW